MLTDFLYEKGRQSEEIKFQMVKDKLQIIMQCLQKEKRLFQQSCKQKIKKLEEQILFKDDIIEELRNQLKIRDDKLQEIEGISEKYKKSYEELKEEFLKIVTVANAINSKISLDEPIRQLKRTKSDVIEKKFGKIDLNKKNSSPLTKTIEINSYFQNVKHKNNVFREKQQTLLCIRSENLVELDNTSKASFVTQVKSRVKCFQQTQEFVKDNLKQTLSKWKPSKRHILDSNLKESNVKIRDYKENVWKQLC